MSTLVVHLPLAPADAAAYRYTLSPDGQQVARHGTASAAMLPVAGRAGETVALVPLQALSWHQVTLPPGVGPHSPRLRSVLEGLLEERLLDEPAALHFALQPGARAGHSTWVAVCDRTWLRQALQALEAAGRPVGRVVPESAPDQTPAWHVQGASAEDALIACHRGPEQGLALLPLGAAPLVLAGSDTDAPLPLSAEPAVAALAEQVLGRPATLATVHERALQAAQGDWDLAQGDLAQSARTRSLRKVGSLAGSLLRAPQWRAARWGAVLCIAVHLAGLNAWAWQERRALATKQAAVRSILTQTFPHTQVVVDAPAQMERELSLLRQAVGSLSPRDFEALLAAAAQALPAGQTPQRIDYSTQELQLRGITLAPEALAQANSLLRTSNHSLRSEGDALILRANTP